MELEATTDIYALGITLMELLTNERPWSQQSVRMWIKKWSEHVSYEVLCVIKGCTEESMQKRYQSCMEVKKALTSLSISKKIFSVKQRHMIS